MVPKKLVLYGKNRLPVAPWPSVFRSMLLRFAMFNSLRLGFHTAYYYNLLNILMYLDETEPKF